MTIYMTEPERRTPVAKRFDVIVCGGGPAGISAAISAARSGARTAVLEVGGALGGVWTRGLLGYVLDNGGKAGFLLELVNRLDARGGYRSAPHPPVAHQTYDGSKDFTYDSEVMKVVLEELCAEEGISVRYHSRVTAAEVVERHLRHVLVENHSGREAFAASTFIDATGNGDLAFHAGCSYEVGHPANGATQPATMIGFISGFPSTMGNTFRGEEKNALHQLFKDAGVETSYRRATLIRLPHPDLAVLMINHQYEVPCDDNERISRATIEGRHEVFAAVEAIRSNPAWSQTRVVQSPDHIGLREGRRIQGLYRVTLADIERGARFDDGVCLVSLPVDVHPVTSDHETNPFNLGVTTTPYHIPLRSLIASDVDNLLMAGRCVSGDFFAHASYRVTGNAVPMGEAAGFAAASSALQGVAPKDLDGTETRKEMARRGYTL